jgi:hypothetical protein
MNDTLPSALCASTKVKPEISHRRATGNRTRPTRRNRRRFLSIAGEGGHFPVILLNPVDLS